MAVLQVQPSYIFQPTDIVTTDKLNLLGTPTVNLSLETPVADENYFRNGNFYSSFWATAAGVSCPVATETENAHYWTVNPNGAAVLCKRSTDVPDLYSLWSLELDGATGVTDCSLGHTIMGDLSATMRRWCTFSGYIENNSATILNPNLEIWTANVFNNFDACTLQDTVNLQTVAVGAWGYVNATIDLSAPVFNNVANGLFLKVRLPSGALSQPAYRVNFSRLKFQLGEVATGFVDDVSLFLQAPSVDSTMLQDGSLARPSLFLPNVIPPGAFQAGAIQSGDIGVGQVQAINLDPGIDTTTAANFTVPAANADVAVTLTSATGISPGLTVNIAGAGLYSIVSIAGNVATAKNLGSTGNVAAGTVIISGAPVTTSGNAVVGCLGYTPINKGGDQNIGPLEFDNDCPTTAAAYSNGAILINALNQPTDANYTPAISFRRSGAFGRNVGLNPDGRFKTVDHTGKIAYLLDSQFGVDTASYQPGSITLQALAQSLINVIIPPGMVRMFAGAGVPSGWLVCDGTHYYASQFPGLYAAIGAYWGGGGSGAGTYFAVPDLRGRSPLGYVNAAVGGITGRAFASYGGEEMHVLSNNEMAYHTHVPADPGHTHPCPQTPHDHQVANHYGMATGTTPGTGGYIPFGVITTGGSYANISIDGALTGISIGYTGANWGHNNLQPFAVMYFIIKT